MGSNRIEDLDSFQFSGQELRSQLPGSISISQRLLPLEELLCQRGLNRISNDLNSVKLQTKYRVVYHSNTSWNCMEDHFIFWHTSTNF